MKNQKNHIVHYLIEKGYKPFREDTSKGYELVPCKDPLFFSTMVAGGTCVVLVKDNSRWCYGLNEFGKPPTLINPRKPEFVFHDDMERYLRDNDNDTIFAELYPLSIKQ